MAHAQKTHVTGWVGWIGAASFMMVFIGILHIIYGFAALYRYSWYVSTLSTSYLLDLTSWGWALMLGGMVMILVGILLFSGNLLGRIAGGIIVGASLIANASMLVVAPVWSIFAIVINFFILYAIIAHGDEMKHLDEM